MKTTLVRIKTSEENWAETALALYHSKITRMAPFYIHTIKGKSYARSKAEEKNKAELSLVLKFLTPRDYLVLFDEKGLSLNSLQFAQWINTRQEAATPHLVF